MDIEKYILDYLAYCEYQKALDGKTLKAYRIDLKQLSAFLAANKCIMGKESLREYVVFLNRQYKIKTVKRKIATLKGFMNYLEFEEIIMENPIKKLRIKLHEPVLLPRTIHLSHIEKLLRCAYTHKESLVSGSVQRCAAVRDIAVLELLFATGIRVSELCYLKVDAINLTEGTIMIYGKGAKERFLQISNAQVLDSLRIYSQVFEESIQNTGWFFVNRLGRRLSDQSVRFMINRYAAAAGIPQHITPHMFRHSFATLLLEEDVDIRYIQQILGHSSILTTQIYTHVASKKQRDILATKHPRNKVHL